MPPSTLREELKDLAGLLSAQTEFGLKLVDKNLDHSQEGLGVLLDVPYLGIRHVCSRHVNPL